jgi:hypothetical protein
MYHGRARALFTLTCTGDLRSARRALQQVLGSAVLLFVLVRGLVDTERFDSHAGFSPI